MPGRSPDNRIHEELVSRLSVLQSNQVFHTEIEIPDDIGRLFVGQAGDLSRAVLEPVAIEAYRSGAITSAQVQQNAWARSRWDTESLLRRAEVKDRRLGDIG